MRGGIHQARRILQANPHKPVIDFDLVQAKPDKPWNWEALEQVEHQTPDICLAVVKQSDLRITVGDYAR